MCRTDAVFLVDFDNVLFDTEKLKLKIGRDFVKLSKKRLNQDVLWREYKDIKDNYGFNNLPKLSVSLSQKFPIIDSADIISIFNNANFRKYNTKDSYFLVKRLQQLGKVIIYSLGHTDYQQLKIRKSGFEKIIGKGNIIIVQDKINSLDGILTKFKNKQVYIIDDRAEVLEKSFKINNAVINIWHRYSIYKNIKPKVNSSVAFQTNNIRAIVDFIEGYIGKINIDDRVFSIIKPKTISAKHIDQIVKFSKHDILIKKFTHDPERFQDKYSFNQWYKKARISYLLVSPKNKLLGIIWFGKSSRTILGKKLPYLTFAIRLYKPARGIGLSEKFFHIVHDDFINTLKLSKTKYNGLWLRTNRKNQIAIHLYKKLGFKEFKRSNKELTMTLRN